MFACACCGRGESGPKSVLHQLCITTNATIEFSQTVPLLLPRVIALDSLVEKENEGRPREKFLAFLKNPSCTCCVNKGVACICEFLQTCIHWAASPLCADLIRQKWSWVTDLTELMSSFNSSTGNVGRETSTRCRQKSVCHDAMLARTG